MATENAPVAAPLPNASLEDKRLDRLLDYTKFHIGIYLSAGGGLVALIGSASKASEQDFLRRLIGCPFALGLALAFMIFAGFAGGIIASCCTQIRTFEDLWEKRQGPHNFKWFKGSTWALIEHGSFWISLMFFGYAVLSASDVRKWVW